MGNSMSDFVNEESIDVYEKLLAECRLRNIQNVPPINRLTIKNNQIVGANFSGGYSPYNFELNLTTLSYLKKLELFKNNLTSLPERICKLVELQELNLAENNLSSLPNCIGNLVYLTIFKLTGNNLISLPKNIGNLVYLTILKLTGNNLTSLPKSMRKLVHLKEFDFEWGSLKKLPDILHLKAIRQLDLSNRVAT